MAEQTVTVNYSGAVNAALRRCLAEVPETLLYGEDVAKPGGVHGVTRGLWKEFGERVFDTPISESAILGTAVGAAMMGRRPIVEIMWADFFLVALDQMINQAANVRYVSEGRLTAPLVVRTQQGNSPGACAQHSQNLEALLLHAPGLRVASPSTPQDAYDIMVSAVYCDDPVVVIDNRTLYFGEKREVVTGRAPAAIGGSHMRRAGPAATVVTWGAVTPVAQPVRHRGCRGVGGPHGRKARGRPRGEHHGGLRRRGGHPGRGGRRAAPRPGADRRAGQPDPGRAGTRRRADPGHRPDQRGAGRSRRRLSARFP